MSMMQVLERVTAQGHRGMREIELKSDRLFEVKATNDKGMRTCGKTLSANAADRQLCGLQVRSARVSCGSLCKAIQGSLESSP